MKKILNGFTLAEALITLAIIGVIASMTIPTLSTNVQKTQTGPALGKAINTLENANRLALVENGVRSLDQIAGDNKSSYFDTALKGYINWTKEEVQTPVINGYNVYYTTPDGIVYMRSANPPVVINSSAIKKLPISYSGSCYSVYIDTNGKKAPNLIGRDIFYVLVDTKGKVIPYGGKLYAMYTGSTTTLWENGGCDNKNATPTSYDSCAGSIVDNGMRVIY